MTIRNTALSAAAILAATGAQGQLEKLLIVDLSVVDQITITATTGNSAATVNGGDGIGVLLGDFFNGGSGPGIFDSAGVGDLVAVGDSSDGSPALFNSTASVGLNFWSWTSDDPSDFTAGSQAFSGSATWSLDSDEYAAALAGNSSGTIWAFADTDDDIAGATAIGTWNLIPAPSTAALLGLGGLAGVRRRR